MANLAETQKLLRRLITAPEGVGSGLAALGLSEERLEAVVRSDERLAAVDRVDVYASMYFYRLRDVIAEDFPALLRILGETDFHNLVTDYLLAHPPKHPSIRYAGERLPDFLAADPVRADRPWLVDLSRFEWAIVDSFDAPDAAPISAARLRDVPTDDWANLRFAFTPSLVRLDAAFRIDRTWEAATSGGPVVPPDDSETAIRVWRKGQRVFHRVLERAEKTALAAGLADRSFAEICESVAEVLPTGEAPSTLVRILEHWIGDEIVVGFSSQSR